MRCVGANAECGLPAMQCPGFCQAAHLLGCECVCESHSYIVLFDEKGLCFNRTTYVIVHLVHLCMCQCTCMWVMGGEKQHFMCTKAIF